MSGGSRALISQLDIGLVSDVWRSAPLHKITLNTILPNKM